MLFTFLVACASQKTSATVKSLNTAKGDTRTVPVEFLDDKTYLLNLPSSDKSYGYTERNAIKVGKDGSGPVNERRFLNALLGPNGEEISYARAGSCCTFKTPNGMIDNMGMLDRYTITWVGNKEPLTLYLNMYDKGDLQIPVGLKAKQPAETKPNGGNNNVLYLLGDKAITQSEMEKLDPNEIESVEVIKEKEKIKNYTVGNYDGVIIINLKKKP